MTGTALARFRICDFGGVLAGALVSVLSAALLFFYVFSLSYQIPAPTAALV